MELEFVGYEIKEPKYTLEEARSTMLATQHQFCNLPFDQQRNRRNQDQEVFFGDFPIMTEMGTSSSMVVNGLSYPSWSVHQVFTLTK